jgi:hypothetical protein
VAGPANVAQAQHRTLNMIDILNALFMVCAEKQGESSFFRRALATVFCAVDDLANHSPYSSALEFLCLT